MRFVMTASFAAGFVRGDRPLCRRRAARAIPEKRRKSPRSHPARAGPRAARCVDLHSAAGRDTAARRSSVVELGGLSQRRVSEQVVLDPDLRVPLQDDPFRAFA